MRLLSLLRFSLVAIVLGLGTQAATGQVLLSEDFTSETFPPAGWSVYDLDGASPQWERSTISFSSPPAAARHTFASANQIGWLVLPALQIPADGAALSFIDAGAWMGSFYGYNGVHISTGSCDPNDGDFEELEEINDTPGSSSTVEWRPEPVTLSLGAYAGEEVCVAFVYEGANAHTWYIDDIVIYRGDPNVLLAEDFEEGIPSDWAVFGNEHSGGDSVWAAFNESTMGNVARSRWTSGVPAGQFAEDYLATPLIDIGPEGATLSFRAADQFATVYDGFYQVLVSTTSQTDPEAYSVVATYTDPDFPLASTGGDIFEVNLLAYADQSIYIAFRHRHNNDDTWFLDDVVVTIGAEEVEGQLTFDPSEGLEATAEAGESTTATFTITNPTEEPIAFDFTQYSGQRPGEEREAAQPLRGVDFPVFTDKSQDRPAPTHTPRRGAGGPDEFGYEWIDSNEPGGPVFENIDISTSGTPLTFQDVSGCGDLGRNGGNAHIDLPFSFPFYGESHDELWVAADGFLGTDTWINCVWTTTPLPSTSAPNAGTGPIGMIAPMWLDFDGTRPVAGDVYTEQLADGRFVIQWTDWPRWNENGLNTFQAILSPTGTIKFQYLDINVAAGFGGGPQTGIQNHEGTDGFTIATGLGYIQEGLAVLISAAPTFVTDVSPATGTIPAGGSVNVTVDLSAEDLIAGSYSGNLAIATDEPSSYTYPVTLNVTGEGLPTVSPDPVAFGEVIIGFSETEEVTVTNEGTDAFTITGVTSSSGVYTSDFSGSVTLTPGASTSFNVTFAPTAEGAANATLTVATSSGNVTAALTGTGVRPPQAAASVEDIVIDLAEGETSGTETFTLSNEASSGAADLNFEASVASARPRSFEVVEPQARGAAQGPRSISLGGLALGESSQPRGGDALSAGHASGPYVLIDGAPFIYWRAGEITLSHSASLNIDAESGIGCAAWEAGYSRANQYYRIFDLEEFDIDGELTVESVDVGVWIGNAAGGLPTTKVRLHTLEGPLTAANLTLVAEADLAITQAHHRALATATFDDAPTFSAEDVMVVEWSIPDGIDAPFLMIAGFNGAGQTGPTYLRATDCGANEPTDLAVLGYPEYHWVMQVHGTAGPTMLTVSPESGMIAPGESQQMTLTVDAEGVDAGSYDFEVVIATNDPENPTVTVAVTVNVGVIATEDAAMPTEFALSQNYPNPFAGRTTIEYALPEATSVKLRVYDAVGRLVATLVDGEREAGFHSVEWPASGLASGVYFYRIEAGSYRSTQKMVLVQ